MNNKELIEEDAQRICESIKIRIGPMVAEEGDGVYLYDAEGNEFIDFTANWAVANTGYSHPKIVKSISEQAEKNTFASYPTVISSPAVKLSKKLSEYMPGDFEKKVWFGLSGSDANDYVSKIIPQATNRRRIVSYFGAYHGQTMGSLSMSGHTAQARFVGHGNVVKVPFPYCYRCAFNEEYDSCDLLCLKYIENEVFKTICPPQDTAAIVVEALQCDGGDVPAPPTYFQELRDLCDRHGILLIFDEVKIGIGRTGEFFGFEHYDVIPDAVVFGKPIASGLPFSGVIARKDIMDKSLPASHLFTTGANPISASAGLATLEVIEEENLTENAADIGEYLMDVLMDLKERHEIIGDVRGKGMTIGVELVKDEETKKPAPKETAMTTISAYEHGLLVFYVGVHSNVLEITPPLVMDKEEAQKGLEKLEDALNAVEQGRVDEKLLEKYAGW